MTDPLDYLLDFYRGYLACAEWASLHTKEDGETVELDSMGAQWSGKARWVALQHCTAFLAEAYDLCKDWEPGQAGHSFWLSSHHHGAGFFDFPKMHGKELQAIAGAMPEPEAVLGDDGLLYLE